jgi:replicative DNA helicase
VIGSLLINKSAIETVRGIVQPSDFHNSDYSEALRAIYNLADNEKPVDVFTLHDELQKEKYSCRMDLSDINDLSDSVASAANVEYYAERTLDDSKRRAVHRVAEAANVADSGAEAVDEALKQLIALNTEKKNTESHINQALSECIEQTESIFRGDISYTKTGLTDLDEMINGFTGGRLYVLGARPAMGKTALALSFALDAIKKDIPVMFFSMEMTSDELVLRMICAAASMNTKAQNNMQDDDWAKMTAGFSILKDKPLIIDDGAGHDINYIKSSIRTHAAKTDNALYILDYLQLMRIKGENRVQGIGEITRELKILAKEINCPILILSQLSRGIEQRPDKRPVMSDLRESGEIEQDSDVIMFIYRDEVYSENSDSKGIAEILVRKHRQGETGCVRVSSELQYARFKNLGYSHN